jgi:predicted benzoate:H+ symporter BenE
VLKTIDGPMRFAALTAVVVAALPLQTSGMPMAFWALVAGILVSVVTDTGGVAKYLRLNRPAAERA